MIEDIQYICNYCSWKHELWILENYITIIVNDVSVFIRCSKYCFMYNHTNTSRKLTEVWKFL